ncbi:MAG: ADP-ribosylation factor-like protein [Candidatus Kariarchaeaceae archaeon]
MNELSREEIVVIRTLECDLCMRFDSLMITKEEIEIRANSNSLQIGSHLISHGDHLRIVYFDQFGVYLGDTISLNTSKNSLESFTREIPILPKIRRGVLQKIQMNMLKRFISSTYNLSIIGPSFAGKTSLTMYLETGLPERYSKRISHSPTLGKSVRRLKLGNSKLTIFDMGGQKDFWSGWAESIEKSDKIIFVVDGTANNRDEISEALALVLNERLNRKLPVLILINKMDLYLEGYTSNFSTPNDFLTSEIEANLEDVWMLNTSVFNGNCYNYGDIREETQLAKVIADFLEQ